MRRCLVGEKVRLHPPRHQLRNTIGTVPNQTDGCRFLLANLILEDAERLIQTVDHEVAITRSQPLLDPLGIYINAEKASAGHGSGQWLSAAHTSHAAADDQLPFETAAIMLFSSGSESL